MLPIPAVVLVLAVVLAVSAPALVAQDPEGAAPLRQAREFPQANLGEVQFSLLDPAQFAAVNGPGWVLMDGDPVGAVRRSQLCLLAAVCELPDARGMFVRAMNAGREDEWKDPWGGPRPVGSLQMDTIRSHVHPYQRARSSGNGVVTGSGNYRSARYDGGVAAGDLGPETRPKNLALYLYVYIGAVVPEGDH